MQAAATAAAAAAAAAATTFQNYPNVTPVTQDHFYSIDATQDHEISYYIMQFHTIPYNAGQYDDMKIIIWHNDSSWHHSYSTTDPAIAYFDF